MPRTLRFIYDGEAVEITPVSVSRSKLYGRVERDIVDADDNAYSTVRITDDGRLLIGHGDITYARINDGGLWTDRKDLVAQDPDGELIQYTPSTYKEPPTLSSIHQPNSNRSSIILPFSASQLSYILLFL